MRYENIGLTDFLRNLPTSGGIPAPICGVDAIRINDGLNIDSNACVGCLLCAAYCPIGAIVFDKQLKAHVCSPSSCNKPCISKCKFNAIFVEKNSASKDKIETICKLRTPVACENHEIFNSLKNIRFNQIQFPKTTRIVDGIPTKVDFEHFTESDEVLNLTPWAGKALLYIYSLPSNSGIYEVRLPQPQGSKRYPRPDFCLLSLKEKIVLMLESKRNLLSAKSGVINQVANKYREEVTAVVEEFNKNRSTNFKVFIPLLIGGEEDELLPSNTNQPFYENLISFKIPFISAGFVWVLLAMKLFGINAFEPSKAIQSFLTMPNVKGLLKDGAVISEKGTIKLQDYIKLVQGK
jgi:ferredoxin